MTENIDERLNEIKSRLRVFQRHQKGEGQIFDSTYESTKRYVEASESDIPWLIDQLELYCKALKLACDGIGFWGGYAGAYLQIKYDLDKETKADYWLEEAAKITDESR